MVVTGLTLALCKTAVKMAKSHKRVLRTAAGVHPYFVKEDWHNDTITRGSGSRRVWVRLQENDFTVTAATNCVWEPCTTGCSSSEGSACAWERCSRGCDRNSQGVFWHTSTCCHSLLHCSTNDHKGPHWPQRNTKEHKGPQGPYRTTQCSKGKTPGLCPKNPQ